MKPLQPLFLVMLFLFSCAKEGKNIYIEGRVINPVTGEGIPNIKMELWKDNADIGGSGLNSKIVREVMSDDEGYFVLKHNGSLFNAYSVRPTYELDNTNGIGYHRVGWRDVSTGNLVSQFSLPVTKKKYQNVNLEFVPYANVKYDFNNINCFDSNDKLEVYRDNDYNTYLPGAWTHNGCVNYQGSYGAKKPMGYYYVHWDVTRNGILESFSDTFYLNEGEMRTYTIDY